MSVTPATMMKFIKTLRDSNSTGEKWTALTCITSHAGKGLAQALTKAQFTELCESLINMITTCDSNMQNNVTKSFNIILKEFTNNEATLFHLGLKLDRSKRLALFDFLKAVDVTIIVHLLTDQDTIKLLTNCLEVINPESMKWLAKDSTPPSIDLLRTAENNRSEDVEHRLILKVMEFLQRVYDHASSTPSFNVSKFHILVLDRIATLTYMGYSKQREPALKLLKSAVSQGLVSHVRENHPKSWTDFKTNLHDMFSPRMTLLVTYKYNDWSSLWSMTIEMLGTEVHKNSTLINKLLCVAEKAFKSSENEIRNQAFLCWRCLIDNFALNPDEFNISKRIKLLCIPLNAKNSKLEMVALTKMEVWWHLIVTMLSTKKTQHVTQVIVQFLNFCFGPLGDTPLLSKKQNLTASPGKIFSETKIRAIDALLQMTVVRKDDRSLITPILKERLPTAIPIEIFEESHKAFLHSVNEAVVMMSNSTDEKVKSYNQFTKILWSNLMYYIVRSNLEKKSNMYKELIIVINEMISHSNDSLMITNLVLNNILPQLVEVSDQLVYHDCTLIDLLSKVMTPPILDKIQKKNIDEIRVLIECAVKPKKSEMYHSNILPFIKRLLDGMSAALSKKKVQQSYVIDLWCILADLMTRYMSDDQPINEGTDMSHNLSTMDAVVNFPFRGDISYTRPQVNTVAECWKHLYTEFESQADRIPSVKHNLILNTTARVMIEALQKNEKNFILLAHCLTPLMETINYERLPTTGQVPALIYVLCRVTMLSTKYNCHKETELALKSMDAYVISVYDLNNAHRTLLYLEALGPAIEMLLTEKLPEVVEKEFFNMLEHVIIIIHGSAEALSGKFIASFRQIIYMAQRHRYPAISMKTERLLALENVKKLVRESTSEQETGKLVSKLPNSGIPVFETKPVKPVKVVGSFLGKVIDTSKSLKAPESKKEVKRMTPLPPDPDSQDYIVIKSDPKFDVAMLTEHQKECLKRRREDLAIFHDTSQSASTDTQDLQQWFEGPGIRNESNKENTMSVTETPSSSKQDEQSLKITSNAVESTTKDKPIETSQCPRERAVSPMDEGVENIEASGSGVAQVIVKKLDFESREEFPEGNTAENKVIDSNDQEPKQSNLTSLQDSQILHSPQSAEKSRRKRRGRGRSSHLHGYDTMDRYLKRKAASDNESDPLDRKRSRQYEDTSDSESIYSTDSLSSTISSTTRREISRLKIDMVRDRVFPTVRGRRRSKQKGEMTDEHTSKFSYSRSTDRELAESEQSQELLKKRKRGGTKSEIETERKEETSPTSKKYDSRVQKQISSAESEDESIESTQNDKGDLSKPIEETTTDHNEHPEISDKPSAEISDHDEVVESSQEPTALRSPQRRFQTRNDNTSSPSTSRVPLNLAPTSPKKQKLNDSDETFVDETKIPVKVSTEESKKPTFEDSTKSPGLQSFTTAVLASSSPQSTQRNFVRIRSDGMSLGRGAHMVGLISATPLNLDKAEEDSKRESESEKREPTQRTRPAILRNPEKVSSPSGSRQEKIFNNMKGGEFSSSTQSPFSNLKNDGEKVSPKSDKTKDPTPIDHDYAEAEDIDMSMTSEGELPLLEWSSANPPSLTASPSFSILKRHKSLPLDNESDVTPKRKRVSFADPPVSKQMGYFVPSPSKLNKSGNIRLTARKDTPLRVKPIRPKIIIPMPVDIPAIEELESLTEVDLQRQKDNELLAKIADDLEEEDDVNFDSDTDDNAEDKGIIETTAGLDSSKNNEGDSLITQTVSNTSLTESQSLSAINENDSMNNNSKTLDKPGLSITDDSILSKILTDTDTTKAPELEETMDIENVSRFNSSVNSDDLFVNKIPRTSTQLAATAAAAEADTLPITDSMFLSQTISQCSQGTQNSINIPVLEQLDSVTPICQTLIGCEESLDTIINELTNPLWVSHLANWFVERGLKTIGDLARMSEKQVADIPTKGNPKAVYVKEILDKFAKDYIFKLEVEKNCLSSRISSSEIIEEIIEETIEVSHPEGDDEDTLSATSEDTTAASISLNSLDNSKNNMEIDHVQTTQDSNGYGSIIINSTMSPPKKTSTRMNYISTTGDTLSVSVSDSLRDSIGVQDSLKGDSKRDPLVQVDKYHLLTGHGKILGMDDMLKVACSAIGLDGVLVKLPEIYKNDKDFISKILHSYRTKITAENVREQVDIEIIKQTVREKCSSKELLESTSQVLEHEQQEGITLTLEDSLPALLKIIPRNLVISHVVANDEVIPSSAVLGIGLEKNSAEAVADTIISQFPNIVDKILESKMSEDDAINKLCGSRQMSREQLQNIYATVAEQMSSDELLDASYEAMKKKMKK